MKVNAAISRIPAMSRQGTGSLTGDGWLNALLGKCFPDLRLNCFKPLLHVGSEVLSSLKRPVPSSGNIGILASYGIGNALHGFPNDFDRP
jgi:hypothetical protein